MLILASGCDEATVAPDPPDPDKARQCTEGGGTAPADAGAADPDAEPGGMDGGSTPAPRGCGTGEVCVQGRCYAQCTDDSECGPRERCGASGACERSSGPEPDAGPPPMDAGPTDPCDLVACEGDQVCHPLSNECVDCREAEVTMIGAPGNCGIGMTPVCDLANGTCNPIRAAQCAPCNFDMQCETTDLSFVGGCVLRDVMDWREQVCLRSCDATTPCPDGLVCSSDGFCEPPLGMSCTTWNAAQTRATCLSDADCNIRNSAGGSIFFTETCEGEGPPVAPDGGDGDGGPGDAGMGTPGRCLQPCGETADCFDVAGGQMCMSLGTALTFCAP